MHSNPVTLQHLLNGVIVLSGSLIAVVPIGGEAPLTLYLLEHNFEMQQEG